VSISPRKVRVASAAGLATLVLVLKVLLAGTTSALAGPAAAYTIEHRLLPLVLTQAPSASHSAPAPQEKVPNHILEQYKAYVADLASVGVQTATTDAFFLTILSALVGVLAFREMPRPVEAYFTVASIVVFAFILLACIVWLLTKVQFNNLLSAKFVVLRSMEAAYPDLYPLFTDQSKLYADHFSYGIIRHLSALPIAFGLGAFVMVCIGTVWQIRERRVRKQARLDPLVQQKTPEPLID
jgi:hypothetical protein